MRFALEGATGYPDVVEDTDDDQVFIDPVSDGPLEPLSVRLYIGGTMVCVMDVEELERAIAYAKGEKVALDAYEAEAAASR